MSDERYVLVPVEECDREAAVNLAHALGMDATTFTDGACDVLVQALARHRLSARDLDAFGASDAACYLYPGADQQAERAAFCEGAAFSPQSRIGVQVALTAMLSAAPPPDDAVIERVEQCDRDLRTAILKHIVDALDRPCGPGDMIEDRQDALDRLIARHRTAAIAALCGGRVDG